MRHHIISEELQNLSYGLLARRDLYDATTVMKWDLGLTCHGPWLTDIHDNKFLWLSGF
jgi:hypothetical protein